LPFKRRRTLFTLTGVWALLAGCVHPSAPADTGARITAADAEPGNWLSHGRNYQETRHSPLTQLTRANVSGLGLVWSFDLDTHRGQESTPLVVDGVMYTTSA
jgi:glucose dehydrogenase